MICNRETIASTTHNEDKVGVLPDELFGVLFPALMEARQAPPELTSMLYMLQIRLGDAEEWHIDEEAEKPVCDGRWASRHVDGWCEATGTRSELIDCVLSIALRMTVTVCMQTDTT